MRLAPWIVAIALSFSSGSAAVLDGTHRQGLVEGCMETYISMPAPPAELAAIMPALKYRSSPDKLREFCTCHADTSYAPVAQEDYAQYLLEIRNGQQGPAFAKVAAVLAEQAPIADQICNTKLAAL